MSRKKTTGDSHGKNFIRKEKRYAIYLRDGMACAYCERDLSGEQDGGVCQLDHLSAKGGEDPANLVTACRECNTAKAGRPVAEFASAAAQERIAALIAKPIDKAAAVAFLERKKGGGKNQLLAMSVEVPEIRIPPRQMAELAFTTEGRLFELQSTGKIPAITAEGYDGLRTLSAMVVIRSGPSLGERLQEAKARTQEAEAVSAEIQAAKDTGAACLVGEIEAQWEDVSTQVRVIVETFPGLTEKQRDGLLEKLATVKLSETEVEK